LSEKALCLNNMRLRKMVKSEWAIAQSSMDYDDDDDDEFIIHRLVKRKSETCVLKGRYGTRNRVRCL
jgi:hypothetical protein